MPGRAAAHLTLPPKWALLIKNRQKISKNFFPYYIETLTERLDEINTVGKSITENWCIGSAAFKASLSHELLNHDGIEHGALLKEQTYHKAIKALERGLGLLDKNKSDVEQDKFSAHWKLALACILKEHFKVSNQWLSSQLNMGKPGAVSNNLGVYKRTSLENCFYKAKLNMTLLAQGHNRTPQLIGNTNQE